MFKSFKKEEIAVRHLTITSYSWRFSTPADYHIVLE